MIFKSHSYRQCMHITGRLLNICYFLRKKKKATKKVKTKYRKKKKPNKLTFPNAEV